MDTLNRFILELDSVSYSINQKKLINNISVKINAGDIVSIVGPNGSGKSTLVKLISTEILPTSGNIIFNGTNNNDWSSKDLALKRSVLAQSSHLSFSFSVLDIIKMGLYPSDMSGNIYDGNLIDRLLGVFDLKGYSNRIYTTLSGGEQQRVQLARVIAQISSEDNFEDKLLILDEPTSYLDIKHQLSLFEFLKKMNRKGLTIIVVLHDLNHANILADKIMILKDSNLINYGIVNEVLNENCLKEAFDIEFALYKDSNSKKTFITFEKKRGAYER